MGNGRFDLLYSPDFLIVIVIFSYFKDLFSLVFFFMFFTYWVAGSVIVGRSPLIQL
jgi:hypothetical protein